MDQLDCPGGRIWIDLDPIEEKLVVMGVYESKHTDLVRKYSDSRLVLK